MKIKLTLSQEAATKVKEMYENGDLADVGVENVTEVLEHEVIKEGEETPRSEKELHFSVCEIIVNQDNFRPDGKVVISGNLAPIASGTIEDVMLDGIEGKLYETIEDEISDCIEGKIRSLRIGPNLQYEVDISSDSYVMELTSSDIRVGDVAIIKVFYYRE